MSRQTNARYFRITGRVQGVGFRAAARDVAFGLELTGWVRNCADGDVELVAVGSDDALARLRDWLSDGPSAAQVTGVEEQQAGMPESQDGFDIR